MKNKQLRCIVMLTKYTFIGFILQSILMNVIIAHDGATQPLQNVKSIKEIHLDVKFTDANLQDVFGYIESKTGLNFIFDESNILVGDRYTFKKKNSTVEEILRLVSNQSRLSFRQVNNTISVYKISDNSSDESTIEIFIQTKVITGRITSSEDGQSLPGVNVVEKGTLNGTITDFDGNYSLDVAENAVLIFSSVGYMPAEVEVANRTVINFQMIHDVRQLEEIVVVGYGVQRRSDITGTVASLPQERLEMVPNLNIAQAIQGSIPGVMIQTTSAGARSSQAIMIRGRNSILADNTPLIVVDGIPYGGQLNDVNPNDVQSIEVLKDASAAAIYGSRGSNGVILITTKGGADGKPVISYDGKYSIQSFTNLPNIMDGQQFYQFKSERPDGVIDASEQAIYDAGTWVNWLDLGMRNGNSHQHNMAVSGGFTNTKYYISGNFLDVKGLIINDNYRRITGRINVDTKIADWFTIGTRTSLSNSDMSGVPPSMSDLFWRNPLATAYDAEGNIVITPIPGDPVRTNPLETILYKNLNRSNQIITNNYAVVDFPFIKGLSYRLNTGIRMSFDEQATYRGRDTKAGLNVLGSADTERGNINNMVVENVLSFNRQFGLHNIFATGVFSYEGNKYSATSITAQGFPHDFLTWYAAGQADVSIPGYAYDQTDLISQMVRLNYSFDSRYLMTFSVRRDGYSGFGDKNKWGTFPSIAFGWNVHEEQFFPWETLFNELKLRFSYGLNGNQAVRAYESISRLTQENMVALGMTLPGYKPSRLGSDNLGWEASRTMNMGLDFRFLNSRVTGAFNFYETNTADLLLNRTISPIHGITSITQNIGQTENRGFEFDLTSRNVVRGDFTWSTSGNIAYVKNRIVSLYGELDEDGREIDDIANAWFIGKPIRVNYYYVFDGIWQQDEESEAAKFGSKPGYVKLRDSDGDGKITGNDRQIMGQRDPKMLWGFTNSLSYKNIALAVFMHGVHGVTQRNDLREEHVTAGVRHNTTLKNWWTPDNPTNRYHMNHDDARRMSGIIAQYYESASFVRIKDISLSFNMPNRLIDGIGLDRLRLYLTGRNLFTLTNWSGLDPELPNQVTIPLQKEFVFGLDLSF